MLSFKSATFKTSIADIAAYASFSASCDLPEICVAGRSNVGKSSFINMLANQKKLAKTSATPGRTRLLNMFEFYTRGRGTLCNPDMQETNEITQSSPPPCVIDLHFTLVDLPGYGYAQAAKKEIAKWGELIDSYFAATQKLIHVFSLIDIRHEPSLLDKQMVQFLYRARLPFTLIATKSDKIKKSAQPAQIQILASSLGVGRDNIIACSAETGEGRGAVLKRLGDVLDIR